VLCQLRRVEPLNKVIIDPKCPNDILPIIEVTDEMINDLISVDNDICIDDINKKSNEYMVSIGGMTFPFKSTFDNIDQVMVNVSVVSNLFSNDVIKIDLDCLKYHLYNISKTFNKMEAIKLAKQEHQNFQWDINDVSEDHNELVKCNYSLSELAKYKMNKKIHNSFNKDKVQQYLFDDIDYDRLLSIADGVIIDTPDNFKNVPLNSDMRALQKKLKKVYSFLYTKLRRKGKGIILIRDKIPTDIRNGLHKKMSHWTMKGVSGRILVDDSNGDDGCILNTPEVKAKQIKRYGKCNLPSLLSIFSSWIEYCIKENICIKDCSLWKDDIEGAFPQLFIHPDYVHLMVTTIDEYYDYCYFHASMGYTGFPMAWCCVSNAIRRAARKTTNGPIFVFVDDFGGCAKDSEALNDKIKTQTIIKNCINNEALALDKSVNPTKLTEIIGWKVNMLKEEFGPNEKACNKLLVTFFFVNYNVPLSCKVYQLLASLAERYSCGLIGMSAFVAPFHTMVNIGKHLKRPSASIKFCIDMWRIVAILLYKDNSFFNRKIVSLTGHCYNGITYIVDCLIIISDASPWKVGAAIINAHSGEFICYTSYKLSYIDKENRYQNIREYTGKFAGLCLLSKYYKKPSTTNVKWINDNAAAVKWAEKNKCASQQGHIVNIVMAWFQIYASYNVTRVDRIPGKDMGFIDDISRDVYHPLMDKIPYIDIRSIEIDQLFDLCNPTIIHDKEDNLVAFTSVHRLLSKMFY